MAPLRTERKEVVPLRTERREAVPLRTERKEVVPLRMERKEAVLLRTERKEAVPLRTERKEADLRQGLSTASYRRLYITWRRRETQVSVYWTETGLVPLHCMWGHKHLTARFKCRHSAVNGS